MPLPFSNPALSPDATRLVGIADRNLVLLDLSTRHYTIILVRDPPEVLAWAADGSAIFYATRIIKGNLLDQLTDSEQKTIESLLVGSDGDDIPIPAYTVEIWKVNLSDHSTERLYSADAYAISRLMPTPDGETLFFSQIPNMESFVRRILDSSMTFNQYMNDNWLARTPPSLFRLNLADSSVEWIATGLYQANIDFPVYEQTLHP